MTTEEKRQAIIEECNKYSDCADCPLDSSNGLCDTFSFSSMDAKTVDACYLAFFGDETPHIKDSGERRQFYDADGTPMAVRDIQKGKGRCDLMPLDVVGAIYEEFFDEDGTGVILIEIADFQRTGEVIHLEAALKRFTRYDAWSDMFLEVSKHFEEGAKKYGEYNWQKGIPTHCYIDSAVRHYLKWLRGDKDEPHDRAFVWNILCCIWTCQNKPELNDYPRKENKEGTTNESNTNSADT